MRYSTSKYIQRKEYQTYQKQKTDLLSNCK